MQGVFIFIQLLLAEGQEQNSDSTEVYIIFIQKSNFFIHFLTFPKPRALHRFAKGRAVSDLQKNRALGNFSAKSSRTVFRLIFPFYTCVQRVARERQRSNPSKTRYKGTFFSFQPNGRTTYNFLKLAFSLSFSFIARRSPGYPYPKEKQKNGIVFVREKNLDKQSCGNLLCGLYNNTLPFGRAVPVHYNINFYKNQIKTCASPDNTGRFDRPKRKNSRESSLEKSSSICFVFQFNLLLKWAF